jgi:hypothetical protein
MRAASFVSGGLIPAALRGTSNGLTLHIADWVRKTASFFEFSLCLSRACLGKMFVFIYKWLKNAVLRSTRPSLHSPVRN